MNKKKKEKKVNINSDGGRSTIRRLGDLMSVQLYEGKRDIYKALGYKKSLVYEDFQKLYKRQDIAKRIINAPVEEVWKTPPAVIEKDGEDITTPFETEWDALVMRLKLWKTLARLDKLACLGQYAILFLGFDDRRELVEPVKKGSKLLYAQPYSQKMITFGELEFDVNNARFGRPKWYQIEQNAVASVLGEKASLPLDVSRQVRIHPDRIIHVAYDVLENENIGSPVLEPIYNRLVDLELLAGGSAEMFWRGARPGMVAKAEADAYMGTEEVQDLERQFDAYENGMRRCLRVQGIEVKELNPQVSSPKEHAELQFSLVSASTGIPQRVLVGSERGELASTQDEEQWAKIIDKRRTEHVEPGILYPIAERLIELESLPTPKVFKWKWENLRTLNERDAAEVGRIKSETLARYAMVPTAELIVPPDAFLELFLGMHKDRIDYIKKKRKADELKDEWMELAGQGEEKGVDGMGEKKSTSDGMGKEQNRWED